jgi:hypothetical protein
MGPILLIIQFCCAVKKATHLKGPGGGILSGAPAEGDSVYSGLCYAGCGQMAASERGVPFLLKKVFPEVALMEIRFNNIEGMEELHDFAVRVMVCSGTDITDRFVKDMIAFGNFVTHQDSGLAIDFGIKECNGKAPLFQERKESLQHYRGLLRLHKIENIPAKDAVEGAIGIAEEM